MFLGRQIRCCYPNSKLSIECVLLNCIPRRLTRAARQHSGGRSMVVFSLLDQLLGLEESPEIENLPRGQTEQTAHAEDAEEQNSVVGRFWSCGRWNVLVKYIYL